MTPATTLVDGENDPSWDAGLVLSSGIEVRLGDYVWLDTNSDGVQDAGENGIGGVVVNLYRDIDGNGSIDAGVEDVSPYLSTATNTSGYYIFDHLPEGGYVVEFVNPDSALYTLTIEDVDENVGTPTYADDTNDSDPDSSGRTHFVLLNPSTDTTSPSEDLTLDAGYTISGEPASLGDLVWYDLNADGIWDADGADNISGTADDELGVA
ncbi:MAG: hypothetical protein H6546_07070 [Chitinophagales bacterium]|nr:hypothetical protein [Chitinophagales bacterium]